MTVGEKAHLRVGSAVKVSTSALGDGTTSLLISGEVTALEGVYREGKAPLLVARGYDHAHRLSRGRQLGHVPEREVLRRRPGHRLEGRPRRPARSTTAAGSTTTWGRPARPTGSSCRGLAREVGFEVAVVGGQARVPAPRARPPRRPEAGDFDAPVTRSSSSSARTSWSSGRGSRPRARSPASRFGAGTRPRSRQSWGPPRPAPLPPSCRRPGEPRGAVREPGPDRRGRLTRRRPRPTGPRRRSPSRSGARSPRPPGSPAGTPA